MGKRIFDILGSFILLIISFPLMIFIALGVMVTSGRPIFFKQKRAGYQKRSFFIYKFRSMVNGSDNMVSVASEEDKRITRVGRYLRRAHLDELPQLWNVLKGDMSLVGPRPLPLSFDSVLLMQKSLCFEERFEVKPGLTGRMQICGRKWILENLEEAVALEVDYVHKQSFLLDLKILLATVFVVLRGQGI